MSPRLIIAQEGDILVGSLVVKHSEPVRMSPMHIIGRKGDILAVSEPARKSPWLLIG